MDPQLLRYYEAIERASVDMLAAARAGNWDEVVKLEGACVLLISQLKHAARESGDLPTRSLEAGAQAARGPTVAQQAGRAMAAVEALEAVEAVEAAKAKSRIMQRILVNDAEIRHLAEPWLADLDDTLSGRQKTLH